MEQENDWIEIERTRELAALQRKTDLRLSLEAGAAQSDAAKLAVLAAATEKRRARHARQAEDEGIERERIEKKYRGMREEDSARRASDIKRELERAMILHPQPAK